MQRTDHVVAKCARGKARVEANGYSIGEASNAVSGAFRNNPKGKHRAGRHAALPLACVEQPRRARGALRGIPARCLRDRPLHENTP